MRGSPITRPEFEARIQTLDQSIERGFDRVVDRLDSLNGRVRENEIEIATQAERVATLRGTVARWGGVIAAIVSSATAAVFNVVNKGG